MKKLAALWVCLQILLPVRHVSADQVKIFPRNYRGDNIHRIITAIERLGPTNKGEFESQANFEERLAALHNARVTKNLRMSDEVTFVVHIAIEYRNLSQLHYDAENESLVLGLPLSGKTPISCFQQAMPCDDPEDRPEANYNQYTDTWLVDSYHTKSRSYIGANAFGVTRRVESTTSDLEAFTTWPKGEDYPLIDASMRSVECSPQEAKRIFARSDIVLAITGHIVAPYVFTRHDYFAATLSSPYQVDDQTHILNLRATQFVVFEQRSGRILLSVRVP